jgi:DNA (cytosine-5)-methyltransferase 1
MRFGSVCSGIEAASVAWHPLGWKAAWLSEIEPFPSAVLAHHYPDVLNLGDMTLLPKRILSGEVEAPDVFCGGTPCQAFSVAGLRNSLDDARGNLSLTFVGIANAIDHVRSIRGESASIVFWENVPGVLSTKDNAFGCFLAGLAGEDNPLEPAGGKWTNAGYVLGPKRAVAWRVLDAQYFGVAQRRKRVFVVASARADFDPAAVLFEFEGLRRDTAPSRETGQAVAASTIPSIAGSLDTECGGGKLTHQSVANGHIVPAKPQWLDGGDLAATITTRSDDKRMPDKANAQLVMQPVFEMHGQDSRVRDLGDTCSTVTSKWGTGGGNVPVTLQPAMAVRRLTPVECERLQGFPDNYTAIPWRKKPIEDCPDGPRYKALGNSMAVPVMAWIGKRIANAA